MFVILIRTRAIKATKESTRLMNDTEAVTSLKSLHVQAQKANALLRVRKP